MNPDDMIYDIRTLKYRRRRNEVTEKQIREHLDELPDEADLATTTETQFVSTFEERNYRS